MSALPPLRSAMASTVEGGEQKLSLFAVASQLAIKQLGINGGGIFNANSAHPFESPSAWINLFHIFLLLVIPFSLPRAFGRLVGDTRQGNTVLAVMSTLWLAFVAMATRAELAGSGLAHLPKLVASDRLVSATERVRGAATLL